MPNSHRLAWPAIVLLGACSDATFVPPDLSVADLPLPVETMLAPAQTTTTCLAVDGKAVYWTDQAGGTSKVLKASIGGGGAQPTTLASGADTPGCVAIDATSAYFVAGDQIMAVPLDGSASPAPIASGQHVLQNNGFLYTQGGYVWWITDVYGSVDAFNGKNAIVRAKAGSAVEVMYAGVIGNPGGLAVDASNYYYSDANGVFVVARSSSFSTPVGTSALHHNSFAIDSMHLAMVDANGNSQGDVALMQLDGSQRKVVSQMLAAAVTLDGSGVYARQGNHLVRFALDGSQTLTLAYGSPRAIALDAGNVYFTDGASIQKLPKPQ
jgi:hypothetical protein